MVNQNLDKTTETIHGYLGEIGILVDELGFGLSGKMVTPKVQEAIGNFRAALEDSLKHGTSGSEVEGFFVRVGHAQVFSEALSKYILQNNSFDPGSKIESLASRILEVSKELKGFLEQRTVVYVENKTSKNQVKPAVKGLRTEELISEEANFRTSINSLKSELLKHKKRESVVTGRVEQLQVEIAGLEKHVKQKITNMETLYAASEVELIEKKESVNLLLGKISEGVIAHSYDESANEEKEAANWLRIGSLACMALIAIVVSFSLYETTLDTFNWKNSSFRLVFTLLLSAPAAYMAKESAKHRMQQYTHLQTSLDLKAIGPYLASFPIDEQNKIKSDIAKRLFAPKHFNDVETETMPINAQEVLLKLIDKINVNGK